MTEFIRAHGGRGVLMPSDVPSLQKGIREAYEILRDGEWHSGTEIKQRHSQGGGEALRRVRDLRPKLTPDFVVEKCRAKDGSRNWLYRISRVHVPEEQGDLFA